MKAQKTFLIACMTLISIISVHAQEKTAPQLCEKLSVFRPFVATTWIGGVPGDARMGDIVLTWEIIADGFAVRLKRDIFNFNHRLETTFYWDESSGKIAYLALSDNGVVIKGFVAGEGDALICQGNQRGPNVNRTSKRIYKIDQNGKLLEDDLFRNSDAEDWQRTHVAEFSPQKTEQ